jgi:hypothetical protein
VAVSLGPHRVPTEHQLRSPLPRTRHSYTASDLASSDIPARSTPSLTLLPDSDKRASSPRLVGANRGSPRAGISRRCCARSPTGRIQLRDIPDPPASKGEHLRDVTYTLHCPAFLPASSTDPFCRVPSVRVRQAGARVIFEDRHPRRDRHPPRSRPALRAHSRVLPAARRVRRTRGCRNTPLPGPAICLRPVPRGRSQQHAYNRADCPYRGPPANRAAAPGCRREGEVAHGRLRQAPRGPAMISASDSDPEDQRSSRGFSLERRSGGWSVRVRHGGRRPRRTFPTEELADAFITEAAAAREAGHLAQLLGRHATLSHWFDEMLRETARDKYAPSTVRDYVEAFTRHVEPHIGHVPVSSVHDHLDEWVRELRRPPAVGIPTIHKAASALSAALEHARGRGCLAANPMPGFRLPRRAEDLIRRLRPAR